MPINQHSQQVGSDPDSQPRACAYPGCRAVTPQGQAHNLGVVYLQSAGQAPSYQCADVEHWTCSHHHAVLMAHLCLDEHVLSRLTTEDWSGNPARWDHPALNEPHACEASDEDGGDCSEQHSGHDMHGFVVTYRFPGGALNALGARECGLHLGCSPEHAAKAAHACIDAHTAAIRDELKARHVELLGMASPFYGMAT